MLSRGSKLRLGVTYWTTAAAIFGIVGWSTVTVVGMQKDLSQAEKDRAALSQQVEDLGGTPVAGPKGEDGQRGTPGRDGRDGDTGTPGEDGTDGRDGSPGVAGSDGKDGTDGSPGPQGPQGADGKDGRDGADGAQGPQGEQGEPGPACPSGYTPTNAEVNGKPVIVCARTTLMKG